MLQNGNWTKATVNGKKAALSLFNDWVWLHSYTSAWDVPQHEDYNDVPKHGFFKHMRLVGISTENLGSWSDVRFALRGVFDVYFPGEEGYERTIRRRRNNNAEESTSSAAPAEPTEPRPDIDFYLPNYTYDRIYCEQHGYHTSHIRGYMNSPVRSYSGHRIGVELEVEAVDSSSFSAINHRTSNWFTRERDSSLGSNGIEIITIPLLPEDAKSYGTWQPLCDYLRGKALSWDTGRCGLHVHIGREILGNTEDEQQLTLGKLLIFYQSEIEHWTNANKVWGRDICYHQPDGNTDELKAMKLLGKEVLKERTVFNKVDNAMKRKFGTSRYYAVNLQNSATIEFRKGKGSINADRIIAIITFAESIALFCRETLPENLTLDAFRAWLHSNVGVGNPLYRYLFPTQVDL